MELLTRFIKGDPEAFETLFRQFQKEVFGWIFRIVRDPGAAEELTVETFWRVYRSRARFDPARSFGAWVRRIATNQALSHLKRSPKGIRTYEDSPSLRRAADDDLIHQDTRRQIQIAFGQLPPKLRLTATLALIEEIPYEEIAESLGVPIGTVKSRVFRATRILREKLKKMGIER